MSLPLFACFSILTTGNVKRCSRQEQPPLPLVREIRFFSGVSKVYLKMKAVQAHSAVCEMLKGGNDSADRWVRVHEDVGRDLYRLCAGLGGAYVKVGQFLSARPDLVPEPWCRALGVLCDAVAPMDSLSAQQIAEEEVLRVTGGAQRLGEWCSSPLGSASVAQVHAAVLEPAGEPSGTTSQPPAHRLWWRFWCGRGGGSSRARVAVKVRRPQALMLFERDLRACRRLAAFLQRFEMSIDLVSAVDELADRVHLELDFTVEYAHLVRTGSVLRRTTRGAIVAPKALLSTQSCLVTELCDATPLSVLARNAINGRGDGKASLGRGGGELRAGVVLDPAAARAVRDGVRELYGAYGRMILCADTFHADPHRAELSLDLTTFGSTRCPSPCPACSLAHPDVDGSRLVCAVGNLLVPTSLHRRVSLAVARQCVPPPLRWVLPFAPPRLYLVDWGQCGGPTTPLRRRQLARLYLELSKASPEHFSQQRDLARRVASALAELGVVASAKDGRESAVEQAELARGMFDLKGEIELHDGVEFDNGRLDAVPKDLFLVIRVAQMLSGLGHAAEKAGAPSVGRISSVWRPHAKRAARAPGS
jgi:predicted unusual protein kinase regulating ubiquinone biosynthesis (AarF/ABC1/UbiB family)